jgi:hypothetical protein
VGQAQLADQILVDLHKLPLEAETALVLEVLEQVALVVVEVEQEVQYQVLLVLLGRVLQVVIITQAALFHQVLAVVLVLLGQMVLEANLVLVELVWHTQFLDHLFFMQVAEAVVQMVQATPLLALVAMAVAEQGQILVLELLELQIEAAAAVDVLEQIVEVLADQVFSLFPMLALNEVLVAQLLLLAVTLFIPLLLLVHIRPNYDYYS